MWPSALVRPVPTPRQVALERIGLGLLIAIALIGFFAFPTYPNYDSIYSLLWGREILALHTPTFDAFRAPTEHPLSNLVGGVLSLLGTVGDRVWIFVCIASMVFLLVGLYRLGRDLFGIPAQHRHRGYPLPRGESGALGRRAHRSRHLHAGGERWFQPKLILTAQQQQVGKADAGGADVDDDRIPWGRFLDVDVRQPGSTGKCLRYKRFHLF